MTCHHESLGAEMCPECGFCNHEIIFKDLCAICGSLVTQDDRGEESTKNKDQHLDISHTSDGVRVSFKEAQRLEKKDEERLLKERKLSLIVDLDQTVLHAAWEPHIAKWVDDHKAENDPLAKNMFTFSLDGANKYTIKLRPGLTEFLQEISKYFEMHIYTMGTRAYAEAVAKVIDPTQELFRDRILSRDENGSITKKRLERLFPSDHTKVIVLDDRADVWDFSQNLIQIKPYEYFAGVGDINAPPNSVSTNPGGGSAPLKNMTTTETTDTTTTDTTTIDKATNNVANATEDDGKQRTATEIGQENQPTTTTIVNDDAVNESIVNDIKHKQNIPFQTGATVPVIDSEKLAAADEEDVQVNRDEKENEICSNSTAPTSSTIEAAAAAAVTPASQPKNNNFNFNNANYTPKSHDHDTTLKVVQQALIEAHHRFYEKVEKENARPNVADILNVMKSRVLAGCHLVFSGVIPLQIDPTTSSIWKMATAHGAQCWEELTGKVTHLIAAQPCTTKVNKARKYSKIQIVSPPWLYHSIWNWKKEDEDKYKLDLPQDKYADSDSSESEDIKDIEAVDRAFDRFTKQKGKERANEELTQMSNSALEDEIKFDWTDDEVDDAMNEDDSDDDGFDDTEGEGSQNKGHIMIQRGTDNEEGNDDDDDDDEDDDDEDDEDFLKDIMNELDDDDPDDMEDYGDESDNDGSGTKRSRLSDDEEDVQEDVANNEYSENEDSRPRKSSRYAL